MYAAAPSRHPATGPDGVTNLQLSEEELAKLQEIHELINLMFKELPVSGPALAQPLAMPMLPVVPYTHSFFHVPWGRVPFLTPPGF